MLFNIGRASGIGKWMATDQEMDVEERHSHPEVPLQPHSMAERETHGYEEHEETYEDDAGYRGPYEEHLECEEQYEDYLDSDVL